MALGSRARSFGVAVILGFTLLVATSQVTCQGHAGHTAYRAQVDAFLSGSLALTDAPEGLAHDLAWTDHGVQQVWGLGVASWQTPFEVVGRAIGVQPFPDRVAMGFWLALALFVLIRGFRPRPGEAWWIGAGCVLLAALLPAFVTMVRGRIGVYEEAAIYAYAAAMMLLGGLLSFARRPTRWRFLLLVLAAGLTGFIRPTVWFYGLGTAVVATVIYLRAHRRDVVTVAAAVAAFVAGGGALYATNAMRFGSGTEFGHRLNIHSLPGNVVATRFSYPFERAGLIEASAELAGSLFDRPELSHPRGYYGVDLHVGQSELPRWREYYFTTYSWPYVPVLLAGLVLGVLGFRRRTSESSDPRVRIRERAEVATTRTLIAWALVGALPLVVFYLHTPSLTSRYQLDLGPAFAALIVIAWRAVAVRATALGRGAIAFAVMLALWMAATAITTSRHRSQHDLIGRGAAIVLGQAIRDPEIGVRALPETYDLSGEFISGWIATDQQQRPHGFYLNGIGWDLKTGTVPPAIHLFVKDPQFLEVDLDGAVDDSAVRAAIGLERLQLASRVSIPTGTRFTFRLAAPHTGIQVAFLAFGSDRDLDKARTTYVLRRVAWTTPKTR